MTLPLDSHLPPLVISKPAQSTASWVSKHLQALR